MPLPLMLIAAGLGAAGKIAGGITARSAAKARARALEDQSRQALAESGIAAMVGMEDDERAIAAATTRAAAGGGTGGSTTRVLADLERQSAQRARGTIYRGQMESRNADYEAKVSLEEGRQALIGSVISAGAQVAGALAGMPGGGAGGGAKPSLLSTMAKTSTNARAAAGAKNRRGG